MTPSAMSSTMRTWHRPADLSAAHHPVRDVPAGGFQEESHRRLDQETLFTIYKFFENNLNVSETARKLFVHRNTLVYRLEKIKKLTGLDLREFDDAITFKVA